MGRGRARKRTKSKNPRQQTRNVAQEPPANHDPSRGKKPNVGMVQGLINIFSGAKNAAKPDSEESETSSCVEVGSGGTMR
jgi:hypothetical protein